MNEQRFQAIIDRFAPLAREHPRRYKAVVALWALIGLLLPVPLLLALAAAAGGVGWLAFRYHDVGGAAMPLCVMAWAVLGLLAAGTVTSFWSRPPPPANPKLAPDEAPRLLALLRELRAEFPGLEIHEVQISDDMNAGTFSRAPWGLPFFQRHYLIVGLPLLYALTPDEFRAVLAHELAHLNGHRGLFAAWIFQNRRRWLEMYEIRPNDGNSVNSGGLWRCLMGWYVPRFAAVSYLESRGDEFQADRVAARICGARVTAASLVSLHLAERLFALYFAPALRARANREDLPPARMFAEMDAFYRRPVERAVADRLLENCLKEETGLNDTHPCLRERLQALGVAFPPGPEPEADRSVSAAALLGERADHFMTLFSKNWKISVISFWRARRQYLEEQRKKLAALAEKAATETPSPEDEWQCALARFELEPDPERGQEILREFIAARPEHAEAHCRLGCSLLEREDETGIGFLARAMELHSDYYLVAFERLQDYLSARGRKVELRALRERARGFCREVDLGAEERRALRRGDVFLPHDLAADKVEGIVKVLSRISRVRAAFLVRKAVTHLRDKPCYVLALDLAESFFDDAESGPRLCRELAARFPETAPLQPVKLGGAFSRVGRRLRAVPGAGIYRK